MTSAYSSYSPCRQYRENLADASAEVADELVLEPIDKIGPYALRPAFVGPNARLVVEALRPPADVPDTELALLFVPLDPRRDGKMRPPAPATARAASTRSSTTPRRPTRAVSRKPAIGSTSSRVTASWSVFI